MKPFGDIPQDFGRGTQVQGLIFHWIDPNAVFAAGHPQQGSAYEKPGMGMEHDRSCTQFRQTTQEPAVRQMSQLTTWPPYQIRGSEARRAQIRWQSWSFTFAAKPRRLRQVVAELDDLVLQALHELGS